MKYCGNTSPGLDAEGKEEGNRKDRDIGYAPAVSSCERANNPDTCTVAVLDAITAFAVPNPGVSSQIRRFFRVWSSSESPRSSNHSAYFGLATIFEANPFSRRRSNTSAFQKVVNARFLCNSSLRLEPIRTRDGASVKAFGECQQFFLHDGLSCPVEIFSPDKHKEPRKALDGVIYLHARFFQEVRSDMSQLVAYVDGSSHGSPGPSGIGVIVECPGGARVRIAKWIGWQDNNVAEYVALLEALQCAQARNAQSLLVYSDSDVVVRQMSGEYSCRSPRLYSLHWTCRKLAATLEFGITRIPREHNTEANLLANRAARFYQNFTDN